MAELWGSLQFELFLLKNDEPNAFAFKHEEVYIIGIHLSLFKLLESRIREQVPNLKGSALAIIQAVQNCTPLTAEFLMYQIITQFTFYHELGHLHQLKHADELGLLCFEKYSLVEGAEFNQVAHAMEIDADLFAANQIALHILQYWSDFAPEYKTKENLEAFISIASASIFLFFFELAGGWHDLYYLDYDHPHPLIRVSYITDAIVSIAKQSQQENVPKPDAKKCMSGSLLIAEQLLSEGTKNGLDEFVQEYMNYKTEIDGYVSEMKNFIPNVPFLIVNWYKP
ncbi:hypothetical protein [Terrimonas pollutisoli]|uniref:hypothetical protein n=1 Tax=Terrimonas pollutisoli TaxID=3034147 RepID=UPI0023EDF1AE|nr:hypothetical protein [Terrimonas sp. H1YJ31]